MRRRVQLVLGVSAFVFAACAGSTSGDSGTVAEDSVSTSGQGTDLGVDPAPEASDPPPSAAPVETAGHSVDSQDESPDSSVATDVANTIAFDGELRPPTTRAAWGEDEFSASHVLATVPLELARRERPIGFEGQERYSVRAVDWVAAASATGREWPPPVEDFSDEVRDEVVKALISSLSDGAPPSTGGTGLYVPLSFGLYRSIGSTSAFEAEFGFALEDIDAAVEVYDSLDTGAFDMVSGVELGAPFTDLGEFWSLGTGDDYDLDADQLSNWRDTGAPIRATGRDGLVSLSESTPQVTDWASGDEASLATFPGVAEVASALDGYGPYAFVVEVGDFRATPRFAEALPLYEITEPFFVYGIGFTIIDGRRHVVVATAFATDQAASAMIEPTTNVWNGFADPAIREPMSETFEVVDVSSDGLVVTTLVAAQGDRRIDRAYEFLLRGEPVAAHR